VFAPADLAIQLLGEDADPIGRTLEALLGDRMIGLLEADADSGSGAIIATVAFIPERGLGVDDGGSIQATPPATCWRRIPHRHPRLAVALIAIELALTGALAAAALLPPYAQPVTTIQWAGVVLLGADAVFDAVLLARIRRARAAYAR